MPDVDVRARSVLAGGVLGVAWLLGCSAHHDWDPIVAGTFELDVVPLPNGDLGARIEIEADGTFTGHVESSHVRCNGRLTDAEWTDIVAAARAVELYEAESDLSFEGCLTDFEVHDVRLRGRGGCNTVRAFACGSTPRFGELLQASTRPVSRAFLAGECVETDMFDYPPSNYWAGQDRPFEPAILRCE